MRAPGNRCGHRRLLPRMVRIQGRQRRQESEHTADGRPGESKRGRGTGQGEDQGRNGKAFGKSEESHERQEIRRASALMGKANEKQLRGDWAMRLPANLGMMLLAIWL